MDPKIKNIEEKITLIQNDMLNMSQEIYNQQKEILELNPNNVAGFHSNFLKILDYYIVSFETQTLVFLY